MKIFLSNITRTLPEILKIKVSWALSFKILPPEIAQRWEIAFLGILGGPGNKCGIQCFFMILWISKSFNLCLLVKNTFNFKLGFFILHLFWIYFRGYHQKEHFRSDYHSVRWFWCKKDQKNLPQTSHKIFCQCRTVNSSMLCAFMVQNFCKNSFSGGKSRKNDIPVKKLPFLCKKP